MKNKKEFVFTEHEYKIMVYLLLLVAVVFGLVAGITLSETGIIAMGK